MNPALHPTGPCSSHPERASCDSGDPVWICLRSKPKKEHALARALREDPLIEAFCPRIRFRRNTVRGLVWFQEALFPGYLFVLLDPPRDLRRVSSTQGAIGPVRFSTGVATIPASVIAGLKQSYAEAPDEPLTLPDSIVEGQQLHLVDGPFQGLLCTVKSYFPSRQRVEILLEFLGQTITAQVSPAMLVSARGAVEARAHALSCLPGFS